MSRILIVAIMGKVWEMYLEMNVKISDESSKRSESKKLYIWMWFIIHEFYWIYFLGYTRPCWSRPPHMRGNFLCKQLMNLYQIIWFEHTEKNVSLKLSPTFYHDQYNFVVILLNIVRCFKKGHGITKIQLIKGSYKLLDDDVFSLRSKKKKYIKTVFFAN